MRVNIYAEEMTDRAEIAENEIDGVTFTGIRFYLYLPVTMPLEPGSDLSRPIVAEQVRGPFMHHPGDDDSSAVTFWGKRDLHKFLDIAQRKLHEHYDNRERSVGPEDAASE